MEQRYLQVTNSADPEILEILHENIIGTPGISMLYKHTGAVTKINNIPDPYFVSLRKSNSTIGTCCFCKRMTLNVDIPIQSFYVRYFAFKDAFKSGGIHNRTSSVSSVLRTEIKALLDGTDFDLNLTRKFFLYAYVDPRNVRSARLCREFGFESIRNYTTIIFNRIWPENDARVTQGQAKNEEIKHLLSTFYRGYSMLSFENFLGSDKYTTIQVDGKIVAGAQATRERWNIISLPGLSGKVILNAFSSLPLLNRLFNKDYHFLVVEAVYFAPGYEQYLEILLESLLARHRVNNAIIVVDKNSRVYNALRLLDLGWVDTLNKEVSGHVICKFVNFDNEEIRMFKNNPAYISGIDVT